MRATRAGSISPVSSKKRTSIGDACVVVGGAEQGGIVSLVDHRTPDLGAGRLRMIADLLPLPVPLPPDLRMARPKADPGPATSRYRFGCWTDWCPRQDSNLRTCDGDLLGHRTLQRHGRGELW